MKVQESNFSAVYEKYKNTVYGVTYNFMRNVSDAEDILQDVFVTLLRYDGEFDSEEHLKAWLIRVAVNASKKQLRNKAGRETSELPEDLAAETKEEQSDVMAALLSLPEKYRIPLHLYYYEGYSTKEIAKALSCAEVTVRVQLKRGREKMKELLMENA